MDTTKLSDRTLCEINKMLSASLKEVENDCKKGELLGLHLKDGYNNQTRVLSIDGGKSLIITLSRPELAAFPHLCLLIVAKRNMSSKNKFDLLYDTNCELMKSDTGKIRADDSANIRRMIKYLSDCTDGAKEGKSHTGNI